MYFLILSSKISVVPSCRVFRSGENFILFNGNFDVLSRRGF